MTKKPQVAIVMGSDSDLPAMKDAAAVLKTFEVPYEMRVLSAHRTPHDVTVFAEGARRQGIKVIIAGAGGAAHLAGVIASHTTLPVIGVPMETKSLHGLDSLLSVVQMPSGVPVATVTIGATGAKNAAILALQIIALSDRRIADALVRYKRSLADGVKKKDRDVSCTACG